MSRRKTPTKLKKRTTGSTCGEGTWFAVPLKKGGYAVGIVSRGNPRTVLIAYFFGPRRTELPTIEEVEHWKAEDALCVWQTSGLEIRSGKWPTIGQSTTFRREDWPMPVFAYKTPDLEGFPGWTELRYYSEENPNELRGMQRVRGKEADEALKTLERDSLYGAEATEIGLDMLLS